MTSPEMPAHPEWPTTTPEVVEEAHRCIAKRQKTVRGCPSRKDIKAGPHRKIVIDEVFGLLTVTGRAPNDRKHRRVHVHCACGRDGTCRFDELCRGIAKSHGCLEDQAFRRIFGGLAAGMGRGKKTAIFTDLCLE